MPAFHATVELLVIVGTSLTRCVALQARWFRDFSFVRAVGRAIGLPRAGLNDRARTQLDRLVLPPPALRLGQPTFYYHRRIVSLSSSFAAVRLSRQRLTTSCLRDLSNGRRRTSASLLPQLIERPIIDVIFICIVAAALCTAFSCAQRLGSCLAF